jgi:hypothetical protein
MMQMATTIVNMKRQISSVSNFTVDEDYEFEDVRSKVKPVGEPGYFVAS